VACTRFRASLRRLWHGWWHTHIWYWRSRSVCSHLDGKARGQRYASTQAWPSYYTLVGRGVCRSIMGYPLQPWGECSLRIVCLVAVLSTFLLFI
jgi:hypothetical protein